MGQHSRTSIAGHTERSVWTRPGPEALCTRLFEPTLRGDNQRPLSKGTVVLAPPMGREWMSSHVVVRQLAMALARDGWSVARVCWRGSGDSMPLTGDDAVSLWGRDILDTADHAEQLCGTRGHRRVVIGYRIGAALAATVADSFDHAVFWEPVSGRQFLRQWSRTRRVWMSDIPVGDGTDLLGLWLDDKQAASLDRLTAPVAGQSTHHINDGPQNRSSWTVYTEGDVKRAKVMYGADPLSVRVHHDVLRDVMKLLPTMEPVPTTQRLAGGTVNTTVLNGVQISEEIVTVPNGGWPGVLTGPAGAGGFPSNPRMFAPALMVSAAAEPADCAGLWPETARQMAALGRMSLRSDRTGCGDHSPFGEDKLPVPMSDACARSTRDQGLWLQARGGGVPLVGVGVSAGGWTLMRMLNERVFGPRLPDVHMVLALNTSDWRAEMRRHEWERDLLDADADRVAANKAAARAKGLEGMNSRHGPSPDTWDWRGFVMRNLPAVLWRLLGSLKIRDVPENLVKPAVRNTRLVQIIGEEDRKRMYRGRVFRALHDVRKKGFQVDVIVDQNIDHAVLTKTGQEHAIRCIDSRLRASGL